jgi:catechol 2,3-dioxygenase-like lactoylglutathione lyase family enzyme
VRLRHDRVVTQKAGTSPKGAPAGVHHVALRVADPERSLAFYGGVLGLAEARRFAEEDGRVRSIWLHAGGSIVMLERVIKGAGPATGSGHVLAFAVDDLAAWEARLLAAGLTVADRTAATLFVTDPDGHRVGLSVYPLPPRPPENA